MGAFILAAGMISDLASALKLPLSSINIFSSAIKKEI
jgi:hypothetical protein